MVKKEYYVEPAMEVISLATTKETMVTSSTKGSGSNITWGGSEDFGF